MIVAVPILITVCLFLGWCLIKLTIHALPLFFAVMATSLMLHAGLSIAPAVACGAIFALLIVMSGRSLAAAQNAPALRAGALIAFAAPASFTAYHIALSLAAMIIASDAWRTILSILAALIVGAVAWREVAMSADRRLAR